MNLKSFFKKSFDFYGTIINDGTVLEKLDKNRMGGGIIEEKMFITG